MLDIAATLQALKRQEIYDIGLVRSRDTIADGLTKEINQEQNPRVLVRDSPCSL